MTTDTLAPPSLPARTTRFVPHIRGALIGAYAGGLAGFTSIYGVPLDREQVLLWVAGALLVVSAGTPVRRTLSIARDWLPLAAVLIAYDYTRGAADTLGMPVRTESLASLERGLFGGHVPSVVLQERIPMQGSPQWWEVPFSVLYISHFVVPFAVAGILWVRSRARWSHYLARFLSLTALGLATYVLVPATPPWLASRLGVIGPVDRTAVRGWRLLEIDIAGDLVEKGQATTNLVAALPSLHGAYPALIAAVLWPTVRRIWRPLLAAYAVAMAATLVITGEHYVIDIVLGWIYVAVVMTAWKHIDRRREPIGRATTA